MNPHLSRAAAIDSLTAKVEAIKACRETIASSAFGVAILTMLDCRGQIIVAGIGKSGHIGRKIAATLQSTGTRAAFLHPAEAAHGDMGMIGDSDVILMLSNSGETDELGPIVAFSGAAGIPVIILTSRPGARLAQAADIVLSYSIASEGCPVERAPMASTMAQMTIGDALAAGLMVERGFTAEDFARLHHGGYLGRRAREAA